MVPSGRALGLAVATAGLLVLLSSRSHAPRPSPLPTEPQCVEGQCDNVVRICNVSGRSGIHLPKLHSLAAEPAICEPQERPGKNILIAHEQYLQDNAADRRLFSLVRLMQAHRRTVSILYHRDVLASEQSMPIAQLAEQLGIRGYETAELTACLRPPPALYRFSSVEQLRRLFEQGWFDLVLVTVCFPSDVAPMFAELVLPPLRSHSPPSRQPFVALLDDEAHGLRASRLAQGESDPTLRQRYMRQAASLQHRLGSIYALVDAVSSKAPARTATSEYNVIPRARTPPIRWVLLGLCLLLLDAWHNPPRRSSCM